MADEFQIQWEYSNGNTIDFKTEDLKIRINRPYFRIDTRVDGVKVVTDLDFKQRIFTFSSIISGADMNTIHDQLIGGAIVYTAEFPNIEKIYWTGATTEDGIEVAITSFEAQDLGHERWRVAITMTEKDQ